MNPSTADTRSCFGFDFDFDFFPLWRILEHSILVFVCFKVFIGFVPFDFLFNLLIFVTKDSSPFLLSGVR